MIVSRAQHNCELLTYKHVYMFFASDIILLFALHLRRCNRIATVCCCYRYRVAIELQTKCYRHFAGSCAHISLRRLIDMFSGDL